MKENTVKIQKEIFDKSVRPLITMLFINMGRFDKFFNDTEIILSGKHLDHSLEKLLKEFTLTLYSNEEEISVIHRLKEFNYLKGNPFSVEVECKFKFRESDYEIVTKGKTETTINKDVKEYLSISETEDLITGLTGFVHSEIQGHISKS